ncbi:MAG TPA: choice-of-anchor Q domain-containing protein [Rudaea sp.]|nr:choice-of-anchor Q domain-containing protein [Rudaea sp.]
MKFVSLLLMGSALFAQQSLAATIRIADGDCAGLKAALAGAQVNGATSVVLANKGHYGYCPVVVTGNAEVDGAGAALEVALAPDQPSIKVAVGAKLTLRRLNIVGAAPIPPVNGPNGCGLWIGPIMCPQPELPAIENEGTLLLDSISVSGVQFDYGDLIVNRGDLTLRNSSIAYNTNHGSNFGAILPIGSAGTSIDVDHSTIAGNTLGPLGVFHADTYPDKGTVRISNSILTADGGAVCYVSPDVVQIVSLGGNIVSDASCGIRNSGDRVVADAGLGMFGDNGGLVNTVLLNGSSVAVRNGVAANCEATDARGTVRNVAARGGCDSGAYEFGGGRGLLSEGGVSGFFYDASADGHYVTVQRLDWGSALVIWNTFDKNGHAAWIYSIGKVSGNHVYAQGAQNLGGVLQPGGAPTGSQSFVWGDIAIELQNCFGGTFSYDSPLPNFGSGKFPLNRLAFLGDLDCSD